MRKAGRLYVIGLVVTSAIVCAVGAHRVRHQKPSPDKPTFMFFVVARSSAGQYLPALLPELSIVGKSAARRKSNAVDFYGEMVVIPQEKRGSFSYDLSPEDLDRAAKELNGLPNSNARYSIALLRDPQWGNVVKVSRSSNGTLTSVYTVTEDNIVALEFSDRGRTVLVFGLLPAIAIFLGGLLLLWLTRVARHVLKKSRQP